MEQEKPLHPLTKDESGDEYGARPETQEELEEGKELAGVTNEHEAAVRGVRYAREVNDNILELNFLAILQEETSRLVSYLIQEGKVDEAMQKLRELQELKGATSKETLKTESVINNSVQAIDKMSLLKVLEVGLDLDERHLIKKLAMRLVEQSGGDMSAEDAVKEAYKQRQDAKNGLQPVILVGDNKGNIVRASNSQEILDKVRDIKGSKFRGIEPSSK
ncbi:MAG: hypothetical protein HYW77_01355 [Parcubacteria group bacterium]|nr:hypothetical protein [Parcubacteria group bacterium]